MRTGSRRTRCTAAGIWCAVLALIGLRAHAEPVEEPYAQPETVAESGDAAEAADLGAFVDGILASYMRESKIPSAVVAIVQDGKVAYARGYGSEDRTTGTPIDPATSAFRIGSVSKLFTWTAVMQLVEQGRLDLDADVNLYLRSFQLPSTFDGPVTMRSLMTHTPGFEEGSVTYATAHADEQMSIERTLALHMPRRVRPPLTLPAYSNYGAALAGLIVEQVSGVPFNEYIRRNILDPLGMSRTTFEEPLPEPLRAHQVTAYAYEGGDYVGKPFEIIGGIRPAGSASATALDMTRFMLAHLQNGEYGAARILRRETIETMHAVAFHSDPRLPGMTLGFIEQSLNGVRAIGHGGDTDYFHSDLLLIPSRQTGIFISYVGESGVRKALRQSFADRYFPVQRAAAVTAPTAQSVERYVGSYRSSRRNSSDVYRVFDLLMQIDVSVAANGGIVVSGVGDEPLQLVPVETDLFQQVGGERRVAFRVDASGRSTELFIDSAAYSPAERTPWYDRRNLWFGLLTASILLLLALPIRLRRCSRDGAIAGHRWVFRLAAVTSLFGVLTMVALVVVFASSIGGLAFGIPDSIRAVLVMPLIFVALTLALIVGSVQVWSKGRWVRRARMLLALDGVAASILVIFLWHWNLLGWQFG